MYPFICPHRNDGLYDFLLFVLYSKQEIPKRAVQHRKFWCFNVPVVYFNLLFLLVFGTFWYTLGTSRTPDQKFAEFRSIHLVYLVATRRAQARNCDSKLLTIDTGILGGENIDTN